MIVTEEKKKSWGRVNDSYFFSPSARLCLGPKMGRRGGVGGWGGGVECKSGSVPGQGAYYSDRKI
jgi:hypothetical protein